MPSTYSRDAIQFEADFAAQYFKIPIEEALSHEAVCFYNLQHANPSKHNFDCGETGIWLRQYLPDNDADRQRISQKIKEFHSQIHKDDASRNHYNYAYAQFSKTYHLF